MSNFKYSLAVMICFDDYFEYIRDNVHSNVFERLCEQANISVDGPLASFAEDAVEEINVDQYIDGYVLKFLTSIQAALRDVEVNCIDADHIIINLAEQISVEIANNIIVNLNDRLSLEYLKDKDTVDRLDLIFAAMRQKVRREV